MDEAGLFFKAIPNRSYILQNEGDVRQTGSGIKSMTAKERLTIIVCVNATGSCKVTPVVIGCPKKPRCFNRMASPCLPYYSQKNAWSDTAIYNKWWNEVFIPTIRKHTQDPVLLVLDNFSGHDDHCIDPKGQVKVLKLPPNLTSVYQPLDQGMIAALKAGYKCRLLASLVDTADRYNELHLLGSQLPAGCAGLKYGFQPHVGDAIDLLRDAWDSISSSTIAACWAHSRCLPAVETTELQTESRDYKKVVESNCVEEMCNCLRRLTLGSDSVATMSDAFSLGTVAKPAQKSVHDRATEMLVQWLQLEETSSIEVEDEGEHADELEGHQEIVDKTQLLVEAMPLLERLHSLGAKLGDFCITDAARQLCLHVKNCTSSS